MRPAATSPCTCSGVKWPSRSATRRISGVTRPRRACSSWVTGTKPAGGVQRPPSRRQSAGMKSQALCVEGAGMPGASGELKLQGVPTAGGRAKLPGFVPSPDEEGLWPRGGSS